MFIFPGWSKNQTETGGAYGRRGGDPREAGDRFYRGASGRKTGAGDSGGGRALFKIPSAPGISGDGGDDSARLCAETADDGGRQASGFLGQAGGGDRPGLRV